MNTTLIATLSVIGFGALGSLACTLLAKFAPSQKIADWIWPPINKFIDIVDSFLDLKVGNKTSEQVRESVFGTIAYVMMTTGTRILNKLRVLDTDGSEKNK